MINKVGVRSAGALGLLFGLACISAPLHAALVKQRATGCRSVADLKKPALFDSKIASGDCFALAPNAVVTVDEKRNGLLCVRPDGALDCLWVSANAIDERGVLTKEAGPPDRPT